MTGSVGRTWIVPAPHGAAPVRPGAVALYDPVAAAAAAHARPW
ncbi:hypothetical protein [Krasilnikovia sp. M28-CT-15]